MNDMLNPQNYYNNSFFGFHKSKHEYCYLKPEKYQLEILSLFHKSSNVSIIKSRQVGLTSLLALYVSYKIFSLSEAKKIIIYTSNGAMGINFLKRIKIILENKFKEYNTEFKYTLNRNSFKILDYDVKVVTHPDALRGDLPDLFIIDEASFVYKLETVINCVLPLLQARKAQIILISSLGGEYDESFKNWHSLRFKEQMIIKRQLILEKTKNFIHEYDSMTYRANFD